MLEGRVVIVTGAARGIGQAYAQRFAGMGAKIVATDVSPCDETLAAIKSAGGDGIAVKVDVVDMGSVTAMAEKTVAAYGRIDGLVNNAALYGALRGGKFDAIEESQWDAAMAVNVKGIWNCCKAVVPAMRQSGGGSIINIASLAATYGMPFALHYTTSKAGVIGFTRALARELGELGITVNAVTPGMTQSETQVQSSSANYLATRVAGRAIERVQVPDDLVGAVMFLSSAASDFMTGQTVNVDGGRAMH